MNNMERILVPVDGSEQATLAASWAAKCAAQFGSDLTLLHVFVLAPTEALGLANQPKEQINEIKERLATEVFDQARSTLDETGVDINTVVVVGDPADEITGIAKAQGYNHIVMGSRGLSPVEELILGSVSERVIREAHCAVTIVR